MDLVARLRVNLSGYKAAVEAADEIERLRLALTDIVFVGQDGVPVDGKDQNAVAKWCSKRAKEALGMVPADSTPTARGDEPLQQDQQVREKK